MTGDTRVKIRSIPIDSNVIKLAVTFDKPLQDKIRAVSDIDSAKKLEASTGLLIAFDQREKLSTIIEEILTVFHLSDEGYDLLSLGGSKKYVTDTNRSELKNGDMLLLTISVVRLVKDITSKLSLSGVERLDGLNRLAIYLKDVAIAKEFININGHVTLFSLVENAKIESLTSGKSESNTKTLLAALSISLQCISDLMDHNIVSWDIVEVPFVNRVIGFVNSNTTFSDPQWPHVLRYSLSITESILGSSKSSIVEKGITIPSLASKVQSKTNDIKVHLNTISLINALFYKADDKQRKAIVPALHTRNIRNLVVVNIIKDGYNIGSEMLHQLYVMQTLCLGTLLDRKNTSFNSQDQELLDKIRELRTIAFEIDDTNTEAMKRPSFAREYRKLGFQNDVNPAVELQEPPGILALDCMHYFACNHPDRYRKFVFENSKGGDRDCPFGSTSIELTRLLCDILRLGEPPREEGGNFYPMFLGSEQPFAELFSICIQIVSKTWREMHATTADLSKVFQIVREQIVRSLKQDVQSFDVFKQKLQALSYSEVNNQLQQERQLKEESGSNSKQIVELRKMLTPELMELIQQQRLGYLVRGTRFAKYARSQRLKDKFWFIRLSPSHKVFHYGDCDDKTVPSLDDLKHKLPLIEVKDIIVGKDCPHMKDIKSKKMTHLFAFSLILDTPEPSTLDFVAPEEQTFDYWIDGLSALLGRELTSKEAKADLDMLLAMEVKLQTLELEGIEIPEDSPPVPPEPENYDFFFP